MALYEQHDPRARIDEPSYASPWSALSIGAVLLFVVAVIAVLMIAVFYPGSESRVGDTNAGPSLQTVTPAPSPTTSHGPPRRHSRNRSLDGPSWRAMQRNPADDS